jgi:uncharacterized protein YjbI with pentapeptide repeats
MSINNALSEIQKEYELSQQKIKYLSDRNAILIKVVATVRQNLERAIKGHADLNQAIYDSIDLCRANFVYLDYSSGKFKQDEPLTDEEKVL